MQLMPHMMVRDGVEQMGILQILFLRCMLYATSRDVIYRDKDDKVGDTCSVLC